MAITTIHAPTRNFVSSTTISTSPVITPPKKLITRERCIWCRALGSVSVFRWRVQWMTMPV